MGQGLIQDPATTEPAAKPQSPVLQQYLAAKAQHPEAVMLFNQAQVLAMVTGALFLLSAAAYALRLRRVSRRAAPPGEDPDARESSGPGGEQPTSSPDPPRPCS